MVFLSAGYSANTMTNTVQPRVDHGNTDDDEHDESEPLFLDHKGMLVDPKVKLTPRVDVIAACDDDHPDAENVRKQLDKEESMDIAATGGFNANTIGSDEGQLHLTGSSSVKPVNYKWRPRCSRSERTRRHSFGGDYDLERNASVKRKRGVATDDRFE